MSTVFGLARVMNEVNAPMTIYEMTPEFHGVNIIGVTTVDKYKEMLIEDGEDLGNYSEMLNKVEGYKTIILPGKNYKDKVFITKLFGHFIDGSIEDFLSEEGYTITNLGG